MAVPKLAKWSAAYTSIAADAIVPAMVDDDGDFTMGTLTATTVTATLVGKATEAEGIQHGHHTGVALADLTATFGDPATLADGYAAVYENDSDGKTYLVVVFLGVFWIEELTAVSA